VPASADHPYPPLGLARVPFASNGEDPIKVYEQQGAETKDALLGLLSDDWSFDGKRVLDFGCGAGRTLRQFLSESQSGEFWGADIDGASIDWLRANLCPPLHVCRSWAMPPLDLQPGSFDLIWAISVFTHLTDSSLAWLHELHRLLRPGGLLMATYMGRWNSEFLAAEPWDEDRVGMNVLQHYQDWSRGGPSVLMSDWWVRAHWGRAFEIVRVAPRIQNQSWALMRKRDVQVTVDDLERPEDDPREFAALRHNLYQLQREFDRTRFQEGALALHQQELSEVSRSYETTLSWQVTRPFRVSARMVRALRGGRGADNG
jgi:SAM-dependent methyltransferase